MDNYQNNYTPERESLPEAQGMNDTQTTPPDYRHPSHGQPNYNQSAGGPYYSYQPHAPYSAGNYPPYGNPAYQQREVPEEISTWKYLGMMWVTAIPFVGIILILVWAFSDGQINRRNYARAVLLNIVITVVLGFVLWGAMMALFLQVMDIIQHQPMYLR